MINDDDDDDDNSDDDNTKRCYWSNEVIKHILVSASVNQLHILEYCTRARPLVKNINIKL